MLACNCRKVPGRVIWDANLGFAAHAAQEFRLVDLLDAEGLRLVELRTGVGSDDQCGRLLGETVGYVPAGGLDQIARLLPGERRQSAGEHESLVRERARPGGRPRLAQRQAGLLEAIQQRLVLRIGEES